MSKTLPIRKILNGVGGLGLLCEDGLSSAELVLLNDLGLIEFQDGSHQYIEMAFDNEGHKGWRVTKVVLSRHEYVPVVRCPNDRNINMVYTRESGYGTIDIDSEPFQLGRRLYEAQVMHGQVDKGETIPPERVKELLHWYTELVQWTGQLKGDYRVMRSVAEGKAIFRER